MSVLNTFGYQAFPIPVGIIMPFVGDYAPETFLICDGSVHLRADYPDLYEQIRQVYLPLETQGDMSVVNGSAAFTIVIFTQGFQKLFPGELIVFNGTNVFRVATYDEALATGTFTTLFTLPTDANAFFQAQLDVATAFALPNLVEYPQIVGGLTTPVPNTPAQVGGFALGGAGVAYYMPMVIKAKYNPQRLDAPFPAPIPSPAPDVFNEIRNLSGFLGAIEFNSVY